MEEPAYENRTIDYYREDREDLPLCGEDHELELIISELKNLGIEANKDDADDFWGWYSQMVDFMMWNPCIEFDNKTKELARKFFKVS